MNKKDKRFSDRPKTIHRKPLASIEYYSPQIHTRNSFELLLEICKSLLELVKTSACIDKLLLAGVEGVTLGADFNSDFAALRRLGDDSFAASAANYGFLVLRMDAFLHIYDHSFLGYIGVSRRCTQNEHLLRIFSHNVYYSTTFIKKQEIFLKKFRFFQNFFCDICIERQAEEKSKKTKNSITLGASKPRLFETDLCIMEMLTESATLALRGKELRI
jgi:hypothetical protein